MIYSLHNQPASLLMTWQAEKSYAKLTKAQFGQQGAKRAAKREESKAFPR
jgi:hypothetical protein